MDKKAPRDYTKQTEQRPQRSNEEHDDHRRRSKTRLVDGTMRIKQLIIDLGNCHLPDSDIHAIDEATDDPPPYEEKPGFIMYLGNVWCDPYTQARLERLLHVGFALDYGFTDALWENELLQPYEWQFFAMLGAQWDALDDSDGLIENGKPLSDRDQKLRQLIHANVVVPAAALSIPIERLKRLIIELPRNATVFGNPKQDDSCPLLSRSMGDLGWRLKVDRDIMFRIYIRPSLREKCTTVNVISLEEYNEENNAKKADMRHRDIIHASKMQRIEAKSEKNRGWRIWTADKMDSVVRRLHH